MRVSHPFALFAKELALSTVEGVGFHNSRPLTQLPEQTSRQLATLLLR
jgi:hypothetical protein